jgi:hypothetical protein
MWRGTAACAGAEQACGMISMDRFRIIDGSRTGKSRRELDEEDWREAFRPIKRASADDRLLGIPEVAKLYIPGFSGKYAAKWIEECLARGRNAVPSPVYQRGRVWLWWESDILASLNENPLGFRIGRNPRPVRERKMPPTAEVIRF